MSKSIKVIGSISLLVSSALISFFTYRLCLNEASSPISFADKVIFDSLPLDIKSEQIVKYKNCSKKTLKIVNVSASCGYTNAKVSKRILLPGEDGELIVSLRGYAAMKTGEVGRVVIIASSQSQTFNTVVPVIVNSIEGVVVVPEVLDFGYVNENNPSPTKSVFVIFRGNKTQTKDNIEYSTSADCIDICKKSYNPNKNETRYDIVVHPDDSNKGTVIGFVTFYAMSREGERIGNKSLSVRFRVN